jgi:CcmD family protein
MGTFIAAYAIVWLALVIYILRLRREQRRIDQVVQILENRVRELQIAGEPGSRMDMGV